jgi:hypothetical protein
MPVKVRTFFSHLFRGRPKTGLQGCEDGPHDSAGHDTATAAGVGEELATARQAFLDACDSYDAEGVPLEQEVITQLAPYHDPAYNRAQIIRSFARDLSEQIQSFSRTRERELSQVVTLSLKFVETTGALMNAVLSDGLKQMDAKLKAVQDKLAAMRDPSQPPAETGVTKADAVALAEQTRARLNDTIQCVGEEMIWAYGVATYVVELRQRGLDAYLQNVPLVDRTSGVRKALVIAIAKQAALTAAGYAGGPIFAALVSITEARNEVCEKAEAMTAHYERGALDEMFELGQAIDDEQQTHAAVEEMLDRVDIFLSKVQSEFSAS